MNKLSISQIQLFLIPSYEEKARNMELLNFWACEKNQK